MSDADQVNLAESVKQTRLACWDNAVHATGTAHIFERRAKRLRTRLQLISFLGLVGPVLVGALALAYGAGLNALSLIIAMVAGVGIIQIVVSLWSIVAGWVDAYGYATRAISANHNLAGEYEELAKNPGGDIVQLRNLFNVIQAEDKVREEEDYKQAISDKEKRFGMRASLRKYQRVCTGCNKVPKDMTPTECGVCGD